MINKLKFRGWYHGSVLEQNGSVLEQNIKRVVGYCSIVEL